MPVCEKSYYVKCIPSIWFFFLFDWCCLQHFVYILLPCYFLHILKILLFMLLLLLYGYVYEQLSIFHLLAVTHIFSTLIICHGYSHTVHFQMYTICEYKKEIQTTKKKKKRQHTNKPTSNNKNIIFFSRFWSLMCV